MQHEANNASTSNKEKESNLSFDNYTPFLFLETNESLEFIFPAQNFTVTLCNWNELRGT